MTKKLRRTALWMLILAACLAVFAARASAAAAFTSNFDTDTAGATPTGWTPTGGTAFATSAQFVSAPNSMYLDRTTMNVNALSSSFGALAEKVTIQFWIRAATDTPANYYNEVDIRDNAGTQAIGVWLVGGATPGIGKFQYINAGGSWITLCAGTPYVPLTWYRFKITTDPSQVSDTFDINIYNSVGASVCAVTGAVYRNNVTNLDKFYLSGANTANSDFWVDDLKVTRYSTLSVTATASNPAAASIGPSGVRVPIFDLAMAETKGEEDINISTLKFMASGSGNDLTNITANSLCLYNDAGTAGQFDTLDTLIACASYAADNATATFSGLNQTITAGTTKNWLLTQDMSGSAANASTFISTLNQSATYITAYARSGYTDSDKTSTLAPGATLTSNTMTVNTDVAAPVQSAWSPAAASFLNTATPTVTFTTNENAWCAWATTDISFASTPVSNNCTGGGTTSQTCAVTNVFSAGTASIYLACRDAAYNLDSSTTNTSISYTIDLTAPAQSAWSPASAATITTTTPAVTLATNEIATCAWALTDLGYAAMTNTCTGGGSTSHSCAVTGLPQGSSNVYVSCVDTAGNSHTSADNTALAYFVDSVAPAQSAWNPAKNATVTTTTPTVTFTTDENATCRWDVSDLAYGVMTNSCAGAGTTSQSCAVTSLSQGAVTVYTGCVDALLNANTIANNEHIAYTIDSLPPVQSAWSPAASTTVIVSSQAVTFTTDENATCRWALTDLGYAAMTNACTGAGTTSQTCSATGFTEGANTVYLSCVDAQANANSSADNSQIAYILDTTPPAKSSIVPADASRISSSSTAVTFTTNETATCRWALTDLAYGTMTNACAGAASTSQSCPVAGLVSGATNTVYIACIDTLANADTIASNQQLQYRIDTGAPAFAGLETVVACGPGCFNVYWSAGNDPEGSTPITYSVYAAITSGGQNFAAANTTTTATGTQITGLSNDTAYYIVVRAADAAGNPETNTVERIGITTAVPTITKYTNNPVMSGDGEGFDSLGTLSPEVYYDGSIFHIWYSGRTSSTTLPGYAISLDGVNWATMTGTATAGALFDLSADPAAFDSSAVGGGRVMVNPPTSASKYYMWYEGNRSDRPNTLRLGLAQSTDGISWQRVAGPADGASIFTWTPGTFDNYMAYAPSVIYDGGLYKMWYTGTDQNVASASYFYRVGYATSADGINWNKFTGSSALGSVMDMGLYGSFDRPRATHPNVYKENNIYKMFYSGFDSENSAIGKYRIGYAASPDGLHWTKQPGTAPEGGILDVGATYDGIIAAESSLQIINGGLHLWYEGYNGVTNQYYIMYANNTGVMPPKITNITISTVSGSSVQPGETVIFSAVCDYAGVNPYCGAASCVCTDAVAWSSSNSSAMTINQIGGAAAAVASGIASIAARCSGVTSNSTAITVDGQAPSFAGIQSVARCGSGCLELSWNAATDPQNSTPISYYVYIASATGAENFASASYQTASTTLRITGLTNRQRYFFVARAMDTAANEDSNTTELYESPIVFDTTAPPAISWVYDGTGPTDAVYSTSSTQISALWSSTIDPESAIIAYWYAIGTTSGGTEVKTWTSAGTATSVTSAGLTLTNETNYYVSVKAQNEADLYSTPTVSNGITIDSAAPTVSITSPAANSSTSGSVTVIGAVTDVTLTSWVLYYGPGASPAAWFQIATGATAVNAGTLGTWNTTSLGGVYTLKLTAADSFGNTSQTTNTFTLNNTSVISGSAAQFKWILLSVPVQPVNNSPVSMFGLADYKMYRWDPTVSEDQYTYQYRAPATLSAGNGVWLKAYIPNFTYSYTGSQTDTTQTFTMALKPGWNMIGVPFNRNFDWNLVQIRYNGATYDLTTAAAQGIISTTLQGFDSAAGSWAQYGATATMTPQTGYFARAYYDCDLLFGPGTGMPGGIARLVRKQEDYKIKISASARESADTDNYLGSSSDAKDEYDAADAEEPPRPVTDKFTSLYFTDENWSRNAGRYTNDIRAQQTQAGQANNWNFNVDTNETGETVTITWDSAALPADRYSFTLINTDTGERVDMTKTGGYTYTATGGAVATSHFRIEIVKLATELVTETMSLSSGWNLVSVPLEPEVTNALSQMPNLDVFQFAGGEFLSASQADIQAGTGLWVHVGGNTTVDIKGAPVPTGRALTVSLSAGWNIIGNPYTTPLAWADNITVKCGAAEAQTLSVAIAAGVLSRDIYMFNGESYNAVPAGGALQPWRGYFLKSSAACDLSLSQ